MKKYQISMDHGKTWTDLDDDEAESAVQCGFGAVRIVIEYCDDESFDQVPLQVVARVVGADLPATDCPDELGLKKKVTP